MTKFAFVFPGQGSQSKGMMDDYANEFPLVKECFEEASEALNYNLWTVVSEDPNDQLNQTEYTQPALLASSVAMWRVWRSLTDKLPAVLAGHSLGEYSALVCSGVLDLASGVKLVAARGRFMQNAVPEGIGAMAAIIGLTDKKVQTVCKQAEKIGLVAPANYNSVGQVVISGEKAAVTEAVKIAKEKGAKLAKLIPVSVPSHSELMKPAAAELAQELNTIELGEVTVPVYNNVDVVCESAPINIVDALLRQLYSPVRWVETINAIKADGITQIAECGPGKVLAGLIKRIDKKIEVTPLNQVEKLREFMAAGE